MRPGYATLICLLLLAGALALHSTGWVVVVLAVFAVAAAVVDVLRWRQANTDRTR